MFVEPTVTEISGRLELLSGDCWPLRTSEAEVYIPVRPDTRFDKKRKRQAGNDAYRRFVRRPLTAAGPA